MRKSVSEESRNVEKIYRSLLDSYKRKNANGGVKIKTNVDPNNFTVAEVELAVEKMNSDGYTCSDHPDGDIVTVNFVPYS
jgi:hypothetical protein